MKRMPLLEISLPVARTGADTVGTVATEKLSLKRLRLAVVSSGYGL